MSLICQTKSFESGDSQYFMSQAHEGRLGMREFQGRWLPGQGSRLREKSRSQGPTWPASALAWGAWLSGAEGTVWRHWVMRLGPSGGQGVLLLLVLFPR